MANINLNSRFGDDFSKVVDTTMGISMKSQSARNEFFKTGGKIGLGLAGLATLGGLIYAGCQWLTKKSEANAKIDVINAENDAEIKKINAKSKAKIAEIEAQCDANIAVMQAKKDLGMPNATDNSDASCDTTSNAKLEMKFGDEVVREAQLAPSPKPLVGSLIEEGRKIALMAPQKTGKSALAMQIAIAISNGSNLTFLPGNPVSAKQPVLFYDMELNDSDYTKRYHQGDLLSNIKINRCRKWESVDQLFDSITEEVTSLGQSCTVIIDNTSKGSIASSEQDARRLHTRIDEIHGDAPYGVQITFILVCHTNKDYKEYLPATEKDVRGSYLITSLADGTIILEPTNKGHNYVMLKSASLRDSACPDEVYLLKRVDDGVFLHFDFVQSGPEKPWLPNKDGEIDAQESTQSAPDKGKEDTKKRYARLYQLIKGGMTVLEVEKHENEEGRKISRPTIYKAIDYMENNALDTDTSEPDGSDDGIDPTAARPAEKQS